MKLYDYGTWVLFEDKYLKKEHAAKVILPKLPLISRSSNTMGTGYVCSVFNSGNFKANIFMVSETDFLVSRMISDTCANPDDVDYVAEQLKKEAAKIREQ